MCVLLCCRTGHAIELEFLSQQVYLLITCDKDPFPAITAASHFCVVFVLRFHYEIPFIFSSFVMHALITTTGLLIFVQVGETNNKIVIIIILVEET